MYGRFRRKLDDSSARSCLFGLNRVLDVADWFGCAGEAWTPVPATLVLPLNDGYRPESALGFQSTSADLAYEAESPVVVVVVEDGITILGRVGRPIPVRL